MALTNYLDYTICEPSNPHDNPYLGHAKQIDKHLIVVDIELLKDRPYKSHKRKGSLTTNGLFPSVNSFGVGACELNQNVHFLYSLKKENTTKVGEGACSSQRVSIGQTVKVMICTKRRG